MLNKFLLDDLDEDNDDFPVKLHYTEYPRYYFFNKYKVMPSYFEFKCNKLVFDFIKGLAYEKLYQIDQGNTFSIEDVGKVSYCFKSSDDKTIINVENKRKEIVLEISSLIKEKDYFVDLFKRFFIERETDNKTTISLLNLSQSGYSINDYKIVKPEVNISLNYGVNFNTHHNNIFRHLTETNTGLYIFEGAIGSGKSTYIKYLTSIIDRKFIYLNNNFASNLDDSGLIECLFDNNDKKPVLIIEDAESLISCRKKDTNSPVAKILNATDGLLSDIGQFAILLTYNIEENIDKALFRKGRLKYHYKFENLSIADAQAKVNSLGSNFKVEKPMSLAEIYNLEADNNMIIKEERKIGF